MIFVSYLRCDVRVVKRITKEGGVQDKVVNVKGGRCFVILSLCCRHFFNFGRDVQTEEDPEVVLVGSIVYGGFEKVGDGPWVKVSTKVYKFLNNVVVE